MLETLDNHPKVTTLVVVLVIGLLLDAIFWTLLWADITNPNSSLTYKIFNLSLCSVFLLIVLKTVHYLSKTIIESSSENESRRFTTFQLGDKVTRDERKIPYHYPQGELLKGEVVQVYCGLPTATIPSNYPELYDVQWDNGKLGIGYLPHGLRRR